MVYVVPLEIILFGLELACVCQSALVTSKMTASGVRQLGCEANHSLSSSAEDKNKWSYTCTPPYAFMAFFVLTITYSQFYSVLGSCY
jgi:hypothetical protein